MPLPTNPDAIGVGNRQNLIGPLTEEDQTRHDYLTNQLNQDFNHRRGHIMGRHGYGIPPQPGGYMNSWFYTQNPQHVKNLIAETIRRGNAVIGPNNRLDYEHTHIDPQFLSNNVQPGVLPPGVHPAGNLGVNTGRQPTNRMRVSFSPPANWRLATAHPYRKGGPVRSTSSPNDPYQRFQLLLKELRSYNSPKASIKEREAINQIDQLLARLRKRVKNRA